MIESTVIALLLQAAAPPDVVLLQADEEAAMALSAAPEHLRAGAGLYLLGERTYERVRASTNGFNCLVAREPSLGLAPVCYDSEGSRTNMRADMLRGALRLQGKDEAEIDADVDAAYAAGRLEAPSKPGIAYMLSTDFTQLDEKSGKRVCIFPPHVMFYAPNLQNSDIGADRRHFGSTEQPWILNEGGPGAQILVVPHGTDTEACG